ncbi:hypothetical protein GGX14DRAFT_572981 [Mycena pura]|uniref:Uncharacterized protein n=1 Tax=Mycena pura TaxID=153505 RepID=A0AAD6V0Q7_9AGAR|nr:hypothetical protein GGX14DRAFT_572981 [Mycena pura]
MAFEMLVARRSQARHVYEVPLIAVFAPPKYFPGIRRSRTPCPPFTFAAFCNSASSSAFSVSVSLRSSRLPTALALSRKLFMFPVRRHRPQTRLEAVLVEVEKRLCERTIAGAAESIGRAAVQTYGAPYALSISIWDYGVLLTRLPAAAGADFSELVIAAAINLRRGCGAVPISVKFEHATRRYARLPALFPQMPSSEQLAQLLDFQHTPSSCEELARSTSGIRHSLHLHSLKPPQLIHRHSFNPDRRCALHGGLHDEGFSTQRLLINHSRRPRPRDVVMHPLNWATSKHAPIIDEDFRLAPIVDGDFRCAGSAATCSFVVDEGYDCPAPARTFRTVHPDGRLRPMRCDKRLRNRRW